MFSKWLFGRKKNKIRNFKEVSSGFPRLAAFEEARSFPQFSDPNYNPHCPLGVDIASFIRNLREGNVASALDKIRERNCLPAVCGRVCFAPCEVEFAAYENRIPAEIRRLERFAADHGRKRNMFKKLDQEAASGHRVAVVGSGPAGLMAAGLLVKEGVPVTVFEAMPKAGGFLRYMVPDFRLPKKVLDNEIQDLESTGVVFETSCLIGGAISLTELFQRGFAAVLLACGANGSRTEVIRGDLACGVHFVEELLLAVNFLGGDRIEERLNFLIGDRVAVIGSDNAALDCARSLRRFGKKVHLIYEQISENSQVRRQDLEHAKEEGVEGEGLLKAIEILSDQHRKVVGVRCVSLDFADPDASGQWQLIPVPKSEFVLETDTIFISYDRHCPRPWHPLSAELRCAGDGHVWMNERTAMTSIPGVFAAGSLAVRCRTLVEAMASGQRSAQRVLAYLKTR